MLKKKHWLWIALVIILLISLLSIVLYFYFSSGKNDSKIKNTEKSLETTIIPARENHSATVIFLHGLGNNAEEQKKSFEPIKDKYPHIKFIFPQAPTIAVSMNGGSQMSSWYDIKGNRQNILSLREDKTGLMNSVEKIKQIIQQEINNGISSKRIIIAGHSQGASVALAVGLNSNHLLAGIIGLSSFLPCREEIFNFSKEENKQIPFFLYHNDFDDVIPLSIGQKSAELLKGNGYQVEFAGGYGGGHFFTAADFQTIITEKLNSLLA